MQSPALLAADGQVVPGCGLIIPRLMQGLRESRSLSRRAPSHASTPALPSLCLLFRLPSEWRRVTALCGVCCGIRGDCTRTRLVPEHIHPLPHSTPRASSTRTAHRVSPSRSAQHRSLFAFAWRCSLRGNDSGSDSSLQAQEPGAALPHQLAQPRRTPCRLQPRRTAPATRERRPRHLADRGRRVRTGRRGHDALALGGAGCGARRFRARLALPHARAWATATQAHRRGYARDRITRTRTAWCCCQCEPSTPPPPLLSPLPANPSQPLPTHPSPSQPLPAPPPASPDPNSSPALTPALTPALALAPAFHPSADPESYALNPPKLHRPPLTAAGERGPPPRRCPPLRPRFPRLQPPPPHRL